MSRRLLLQSILKFREGIKSGAAKVQDIVEDYFKSSGKSVTDEDRAIIMNEFAESAPTNVTPLKSRAFDEIDETLDIDRGAEIMKAPVNKPTRTSPKNVKSGKEDVTKDYEYSRAQLYSLVEKGQEAVDGALDVAQQSDSARAYEVAGQLIKHVADTADKLIDLQKKMKDIDEVKDSKTTNVTNNSLFVGSTSDLQKMLKDTMKKNK